MFDEVLQPFYHFQKNRHATLGVLIFLILAITITFFEMISDWHKDFAAVVLPKANTQSLVDNSSSRLIAELPELHLFGQSLTADDFLPITSLQLHLTGIIKDANSDKSQAIVSEASKTGKIYSVGDELISGIKIYSINKDGIVLEHAGRLEKLPLVRGQLTFQEKPKTLWEDQSTA